MLMPETSQELSTQLSDLLLDQGARMPDRLEFKVYHPALEHIKINDYMAGFHVNHEGARHYQSPESFYGEGNTPIIGITLEQVGIHFDVFCPSDISLRGMGTVLLRGLTDEERTSSQILTTKDGAVLAEPLCDEHLGQVLDVL